MAAEKEAIKAVIEKQASTYYQRDWDQYQTVWAHEPGIVRMWGRSGRRITGWDAVKSYYQSLWQNSPDPAKGLKMTFTDYHIQITGNTAWAINDEELSRTVDDKTVTGNQAVVRCLEKKNGAWKIVLTEVGPWLKTPEISGQELWNKTIAYHDPGGVWDKFAGKVHIFTTWPKGNYSEEIIELDKPNDFYQSRRIDGKIGLVRGVKKGKYFGSVDEGNTEAHKKLAKNWLGEKKVKRMKERHTCHIGLPMQLKVAGLKAEENVTAVDWFGTTCYRLRLTGTEDSVIHPYYAGTWTLFIDPDNFKTVGLGYKSSNSEYYIKLAGELDVNGIKMQQTKIFYNAKDDSHAGTDNFTLVQ